MVNKVIWFTGLSASGKTTLARKLQTKLKEWFLPYIVIDADDFRKIITTDLGYSREDRLKNLRLAISLIKYINNQGFGVIASFITPFEEIRQEIKEELNSFLVYLNTPLSICLKRDPKGLYKKAYSKEITNFTGIDSLFEVPIKPDIVLNTNEKTVGECIDCIIRALILNTDI